ncbi:retron system putative HNH endonuclease [Bernardetia sp. OM2101]|uniref:retron system putative HNH endonuclease n=1 Tax=Bernardetia sp. OM2101 TaxID=3344876 RepID=UPI0035D115E5
MRFIKKKQQPQSLIETKKTVPLPKYVDLDKHVMDDLKHSLLEEQGHICCYCMQRIDFDGMQIEHYKPKDKNKYPELQLDYDNLLGVCKGKTNENISHCDTLKKNEELKFLAPHENSRKHILQKLKYTASGEMTSESEEVRDELEDILNLNVEELKGLFRLFSDYMNLTIILNLKF